MTEPTLNVGSVNYFLQPSKWTQSLFTRFLLTRQIVRSRHSRRSEDGSKEA